MKDQSKLFQKAKQNNIPCCIIPGTDKVWQERTKYRYYLDCVDADCSYSFLADLREKLDVDFGVFFLQEPQKVVLLENFPQVTPEDQNKLYYHCLHEEIPFIVFLATDSIWMNVTINSYLADCAKMGLQNQHPKHFYYKYMEMRLFVENNPLAMKLPD